MTDTLVSPIVFVLPVCRMFNVSPEQISSPSRKKRLVEARHVFFYLARKHSRYTLEELGLRCGNRDHTTVIHGVKQIEARIARDQEYGQLVQVLERNSGVNPSIKQVAGP